MNWDLFTVGFWHPFGPHAGEGADDIVKRKNQEIASNGWTLWAFQHRNTLRSWQELLTAAGSASVFVLCSAGSGARPPARPTTCCAEYRPPDELHWRPIPSPLRVTQPLANFRLASAFVVKRTIPLETQPSFGVWWFRASDATWQESELPTRPEYLLRRGGAAALRPVSLVLELQTPFVAELRV